MRGWTIPASSACSAESSWSACSGSSCAGRSAPGANLRIPDPDDPVGDGLLAEVARTPTEAAAQLLRSRLIAAGIRATIGREDGSYRLMVFREDEGQAKLVLRTE